MKIKIILASFLLLSLGCVQTGVPTPTRALEARADALMSSQLKKKTHPGFTVLVSRKGEVLDAEVRISISPCRPEKPRKRTRKTAATRA